MSSTATSPTRPNVTGAPTRAKAPVGNGRLGLLGVVLAVIVVVLGMIGVRDALIPAGVLPGDSWIERGIDVGDGLEPQWWLVPVGLLLVVLGAWLALMGMRPRPRSGLAVRSQTGVYLKPRDVRKLAARAAGEVDGVVSAKASASARTVKVRATATGDDGTVDEDVRTAVQQSLSALESPPRISVRVVTGEAP